MTEEQKLAEFLETASPYEIMAYWNKAAGQAVEKQFDDLFQGGRSFSLAPVFTMPHTWSLRVWYRAIVKWRRATAAYQRRWAYRADAARTAGVWAKHWRLDPPEVVTYDCVCTKCGSISNR